MSDLIVSENGTHYSIRYDGLDADDHKIDLSQLGISLQGFARILAVIAHFSYTGSYNKQYDALSVKVFAVPTDEHHCFEVKAWISKVVGSENLWSGTGGGLLVALINYLFGRRRAEEMKYLNEALKQSMGQNAENNKMLIATIERLVEGLKPSAKQALSPIGETCKSISIHKGDVSVSSFDENTKSRFYDELVNKIENSRRFSGIISEMDMETGTCKVLLDSSETGRRTNAVISDPIGKRPGNPYVLAMSQGARIAFIAKPEVDADGDVVRLHISDTVD